MPKEYPQGTTFVGYRYVHWWNVDNITIELLNIYTGDRYFRFYNVPNKTWSDWINKDSSLVVYESTDLVHGSVAESYSSKNIISVLGYKYLDIRLCFMSSTDSYEPVDVTLSIDILKKGSTEVFGVTHSMTADISYFHIQRISLSYNYTTLDFGYGYRITLNGSASSASAPISFYQSAQCRLIQVIARS